MAQKNVATFKASKNARFADNALGSISEADSRDMYEDVADSFLNKTDGGTITGNLGIGTSPNAPLQFLNGSGMKITLHEEGVNDNQIIGFTVASGELRYQVPNTVDSHVWRAGTSSTTSTELMRITGDGNLGIGVAPTACLHLKAGTATANTAPLKLTTGTALTAPEDGALEYHSSHLYFTIGSTRYQLDQQASNVISGTFSPTFTSDTNLDSTPTATAGTSKYTRVGDIVTVTMYANINPTASGQYAFYATIPVASNFAASTDLIGLGSSGDADGHRCHVLADTTNDRAHITGISSGTASATIYLMYSYKVI